MPQVYHNYKRKSTKGWPLANVVMDFSGGALSFAQILVDSQARGKPVFGTGSATGFDIIKFMLSVISMIFDAIFLWQHFVLYNPKKRLVTGTGSDHSKQY